MAIWGMERTNVTGFKERTLPYTLSTMNKKIVLDTNCLVQMISMHSPYRPVWQAFREGKYLLCVSNDILNEYNEILEKVANATVAHNIVNAIARSPYTRMFDPHFRFGLIEQDPDDNKFVDCAIVAGAEYIVSEDAHFRVLDTIPFPSVSVKRLEEFMHDLEV
jgi:putative PIN family toxin of toxin-antitoxin system